jgi:hypothetical protein
MVKESLSLVSFSFVLVKLIILQSEKSEQKECGVRSNEERRYIRVPNED